MLVVLCSQADNDASVDHMLDGSASTIDISDAEMRFRSWADAKPAEREKLVEEQLTFCHKEYIRLFQNNGGYRAPAKGTQTGKDKCQLPCRSSADPSPDDLKKVVINMRRLTPERVIFHYIHHRAPSTVPLRLHGKLLLHCQDTDEHLSLPIRDVHEEVASPATYIFDCPHAGRLISSLGQLLSSEDDVVAMGACDENEVLPWDRFGLPVDLLTACLMSPIRAALNFYRVRGAAVLSEPLLDTLQCVVGKFHDRNTPLGELSSMYNAITDAIAWSSFEPGIFKRLFREDGALAELFRNFLLAQRILAAFDLHATSRPSLPATHSHHLWDVWDTVLELLLVRLSRGPSLVSTAHLMKPQTFFDEQMEAFWVYLRFHPELSGHSLGSPWQNGAYPEAPVELPIVLHGLLHASSRLEALRLFAYFVDLGVVAVHFTLLVGARPYLTKLLSHDDTEPQPEVAPLALLVWTKMLAFDAEDKEGVLGQSKDSYRSFYNLAKADSLANYQRAFANCCLAIACHNRSAVKAGLHKLGVLDLVADILSTSKRPLLLWMTALLCGEVCRDCREAAEDAINGRIGKVLLSTLSHAGQAVRASAVYALGCIFKAADRSRQKVPTPAVAAEQTGTGVACNAKSLAAEVEAPPSDPGTLTAAAPLFRRFLGLPAGAVSSVGFTLRVDGTKSPSAEEEPNLLWLSSSMISHFCSMSHGECTWICQQVDAAEDPGLMSPDFGILNETSMLVRHELICALAPWVGDLSVNDAACFAYFDSLPSPPWDVDSLGTSSESSTSQPTLARSAFSSSCPAISAMEGTKGRCRSEDLGSPSPFASESIMYAWTINCLQQPNAVSRAVQHDLAPRHIAPEVPEEQQGLDIASGPEFPQWDPEGSFLPRTPHHHGRFSPAAVANAASMCGKGVGSLVSPVGSPASDAAGRAGGLHLDFLRRRYVSSS